MGQEPMLIGKSSIKPIHGSQGVQDSARVAAVEGLDLFDPRYLQGFERVAKLISRTLTVPFSMLFLVDGERQVVIGSHGLPDQGLGGTTLGRAACQHVVDAAGPVLVGDVRELSAYGTSPEATDLGVAAFAGVPIENQEGEPIGVACAFDTARRDWQDSERDALTELAATAGTILELRSEMIRRALTDDLTDLPNRRVLIAACGDMLSRAQNGRKVAVLCAGVDHFNMINQAFGTERADQILRTVGERLRRAARPSDVFGRLRGDVFTMVAPEIESADEFLDLASAMRAALEKPLVADGDPLSLQVTVGIAVGESGSSGPDLVSEAANAMREAKLRRGKIHVAESGWKDTASSHLRMREALHGALDRGEIHATFQPIIELETGRISSFEALARWRSAEHGDVPPDEFIPLAEVTGDIVPMGEWIVAKSAEFVTKVFDETGRDIRVTVNVSPLQISQPGFHRMVSKTLDPLGLDGRHLGFEITEGVLLEADRTQDANLRSLGDLGCRILLDDFGTGYSSLGYLRDLPVDYLKIDRSFIAAMEDDRHSTALIQAILSMARAMDLGVVAEGIETEDQEKFLQLLGCPFGQGYHLGRPAPMDEALQLVLEQFT